MLCCPGVALDSERSCQLFSLPFLAFSEGSVSRGKRSALQRCGGAAADQRSCSSPAVGLEGGVRPLTGVRDTLRFHCKQGAFTLAMNLTLL